ncbi:UPF0481 protein At3g47200 [Quercus suber]|uniref:UPF0481 protein At3g47200 n=1 Tax=Quercus suber TaxID=58331 RepID=UPI0032DE9511
MATDSFRKEVFSLSDTLAKEVRCDELIIDVPLIMEPVQWPQCCIYKVPRKLREVSEAYYDPKLISIGPFHYQRDMEKPKVRYLKDFCYRTGKSQKEIARIIEPDELLIRHYYAEVFDISSEDFVKMVLLDSTFIVELFLKSAGREEDESNASGEDGSHMRGKDKNCCITSTPLMKNYITRDLLLLENQLPFFILDKLYPQFFSSEQDENNAFLKLAGNFLFPKNEEKKIFENFDKKKVNHFTDMMRYLYLPSNLGSNAPPNLNLCPFPPNLNLCLGSNAPSPVENLIKNLPNARKLDEAGVTFDNTERGPLLNIEFEVGNLTTILPCLTCSWLLHCMPFLERCQCLLKTQTFLRMRSLEVHDETEGNFRNLMALEQCHYPSEAYICNYIVLLDFLINTRDDVELLVDKGIIVNALGSNKAVAKMVNKLALEITEKNPCYKNLAARIDNYYKSACNRNMGSLRTVYFRDIWRGTATVVGIIVLPLTILNFLRPFVFKNI